MRYQPSARGPLPVGVVTATVAATTDAGPAALEVWYPAVDGRRGDDLDPARNDEFEVAPMMPRARQAAVRDATPRVGSYPLVVFSHGLAGHRRQSTFLCTHLASRGYVVAALDHAGSTSAEVLAEMAGGPRRPRLAAQCVSRVAEVSRVLDFVLQGQRAPWARAVDRARVALIGHSLGGWTALAAAGRDARVASVVALSPAGGGALNRGAELMAAIDWDWPRVTPTLLVAGAADQVAPVAAVRELYAAMRAPRRLVVLARVGHHHFVDDGERIHELFRGLPATVKLLDYAAPLAPAAELVPFATAEVAVRGLVATELDAVLKQEPEALRVRATGLLAGLELHGVAATIE